MIKLTRYQWTVFFAAWLGWGFDVFDGLLFNYVAPNAVPTLLGHAARHGRGKAATLQWNGILTSLFLLGWAAGGVIFGPICDRFGRKRVLLITMVLYAIGTASCAFVTEMWQLILCRIVASLGIGGEWAAGSAMVAEVVPEESRVEAGALLYTSAPFGLFLATWVNVEVAGDWFSHDPANSWRYVLMFGLLPAGGRVRGPDIRQGAGEVGQRRGHGRAGTTARDIHARNIAAHAQRAHRRHHRVDRLVELQCLHPAVAATAMAQQPRASGRSMSAAPPRWSRTGSSRRPWPSTSAA